MLRPFAWALKLVDKYSFKIVYKVLRNEVFAIHMFGEDFLQR